MPSRCGAYSGGGVGISVKPNAQGNAVISSMIWPGPAGELPAHMDPQNMYEARPAFYLGKYPRYFEGEERERRLSRRAGHRARA